MVDRRRDRQKEGYICKGEHTTLVDGQTDAQTERQIEEGSYVNKEDCTNIVDEETDGQKERQRERVILK